MTISYPQALPRRRAFPVAILPLFFAVAAMLCASAFAADAATGTIQGRVLNAENGQYLPKAVVSVAGTSLQTLTDDFGDYTLNNVPAGAANIKVTFTGELPINATVNVVAGKVAHEDFMFNRDKAVTSGEGNVLKLDRFVVETERYKNAAQIAINEERYSPTIKNVVSADSFGDIPDGNIGEFVKYIPGVQIGYGYSSTGLNGADSNATSISVRGFGPEMTQITVDGVPLTNASPATLTRAVGLDMMSINNASRVEVIKVPTPDMPSDSPGGSINLITKSSFEYAKPYVNFHVGATFNSEQTGHLFSKTPGPANKKTYKTLPSFDVTYVYPINKNMGFAITGAWSRTYNQNHRAISDYFLDTKDVNSSSSYAVDLTPGGGPSVNVKGGTGTVPTFRSAAGAELNLANPMLWRFQATDTPNTDTRRSGSLRYDWRPTPHHKISVGYTLGLFDTVDAQRRLQFNSDKSYVMDWGPDFSTSYKFIPKGTVVNGKTLSSDFNPKAVVDQTVTTRDRSGTTHTGYIKYDFTASGWWVHAEASGSRSRGAFKDLPSGHFSEIETSVTGGQIGFRGISNGIPSQVIFNDKSGNPLDWTNLSNWPTPSITAKSGQTDAVDEHFTYRIDLQRELDFIPWKGITAVAKTGFYRDQQREKKWGLGTGFQMTYYGPALSLPDYMDPSYVGISPGWGLPPQQWVSTYKVFELWQQHPDYFNSNSDSDMAANYTSWANQQKSITETSDQFYAMLSGKALTNRLSWVFGARQEVAKRKGYATRTDSTWNYVKNKDGTIYRDATYPTGVKIDSASSVLFAQTAAGTSLRQSLDQQKISYPTAPILNGTYAMKQLQLKPFSPMDGKVTGKPTLTASATYSILGNLQATLSWNRAQGRPDFEDGILTSTNGLSITENSDPTAIPRGTIKVPNPNLKPWTANSWNLRLAYYTQSGGKFSVSPFITYTKNFQDTYTLTSVDPSFDETVTALGLDPNTYRDYQVTTTLNGVGTAKTLGYEVEVDQNLGVLGRWGKYFRVFGSFSRSYKQETNTSLLSAKPSAKNTASGGVTFTMRRLSILARALWLEQKYLGSQSTYTYNGQQYVVAKWNPSQVNIDLNVRYQLSARYSLFANARNVFNNSMDTVRFDTTGIIPAYAQHIDRREFGVNWNVGINGQF